VPIVKKEMVGYIIDGIQSETLRNLARMHLFPSVQEIMQAFSKITLKQEQQANKEAVSKYSDRKTWNGRAVQNKEMGAQNVKANRGTLKCYECNETGHYAKECLSKKKTGDLKSIKGRKKAAKPIELVEDKQEQESEEESAEESQSQSDKNQSEEEDIDFIDINEETRDKFQKAVEVDIDGHRQFSGIARIDTGCSVSLIKAGYVDDYQSSSKRWEASGADITVLIDLN